MGCHTSKPDKEDFKDRKHAPNENSANNKPPSVEVAMPHPQAEEVDESEASSPVETNHSSIQQNSPESKPVEKNSKSGKKRNDRNQRNDQKDKKDQKGQKNKKNSKNDDKKNEEKDNKNEDNEDNEEEEDDNLPNPPNYESDYEPVFKKGTHKMDEDAFCCTFVFAEINNLAKKISMAKLHLSTINEDKFKQKCDDAGMSETGKLYDFYKLAESTRLPLHVFRFEVQYGVRCYMSEIIDPSVVYKERYMCVCGPSPELCEMAVNNFVRHLPQELRLHARLPGNLSGQAHQARLSEPDEQLWLTESTNPNKEVLMRSYCREWRAVQLCQTASGNPVLRVRNGLHETYGRQYSHLNNLIPHFGASVPVEAS